MDGGIRRGSDVVKALALGAKAVMIGRAYLWGLAANGQAGVENVLDILRMGIDSTLLGLGKASIADLSSGRPGDPRRLLAAPVRRLTALSLGSLGMAVRLVPGVPCRHRRRVDRAWGGHDVTRRAARRRGTDRGPLVERQLQGRAGLDAHRQGGTHLADRPGRRPRRRARRRPARTAGRHAGAGARLRHRRVAPRRVRRVRPGAGRVAGGAARRADGARGDGGRDGRVHGGDVGDRPPGPRCHSRRGPGARHRRHRRGRLDGGRHARRGSGTRWWRAPASPTRPSS